MGGSTSRHRPRSLRCPPLRSERDVDSALRARLHRGGSRGRRTGAAQHRAKSAAPCEGGSARADRRRPESARSPGVRIMTAAQGCPDSLLARARAGTLSSVEKRQLHLHLGQCETCRVILVVGQDFDSALAARPSDTLLVTRVVDAVRASPALRASVSPPKRGARPRRRLWMYGVAAAWLTISCVVGAARPSFRRTLAVFLGFQDREVRTYPPAADVMAPAESKRPSPIKTSVSSGGAETQAGPPGGTGSDAQPH